jgi:hypothetical protein
VREWLAREELDTHGEKTYTRDKIYSKTGRGYSEKIQRGFREDSE